MDTAFPDAHVFVYQIDPKLNEAHMAVVKRDDCLMAPEESSSNWKCALI